MTDQSLQRWVEPVVAAAQEMADCFGFDGWKPQGVTDEETQGMRGGVISLVGQETALKLALLSDDDGVTHLAGRMLEMSREDLDDEMISDALCELANMLAGGVKTLVDVDETFRIGLPKHVKLTSGPPAAAESLCVKVTLGRHPVHLLVMKPEAGETP